MELAAAAGLPLVGEHRNAERTTTYGVGELICHAARHGAQRIVLALGGSATNDGGCGAAAAAGVRFLDENGAAFVPVGATLKDIAHIDLTGLDEAVRCTPFATMCDIDNPLCGPAGASAVFGPQKGADPAMVRRLDAGLRHLAEVLLRCTGRDVLTLPGGGAAGGFGAGAAVFFNRRLRMGIEAVQELTDLDGNTVRTRLWLWRGGWRGSSLSAGSTCASPPPTSSAFTEQCAKKVSPLNDWAGRFYRSYHNIML